MSIQIHRFFIFVVPKMEMGFIMRYLNRDDRLRIEALFKAGTPVSKIADIIGCCFSTVYKELKRGEVVLLRSDLTTYVSYSADIAQQLHEYAQTSKGVDLKIGNNYELVDYLNSLLSSGYSPASSVANAKKAGFSDVPCVTTVYSYIYSGILISSVKKKSHVKHKESKRILNPEAPRITERPVDASDRSNFGHWEMDCVCSCQGKLPVLLCLTERMTRFEIILKMVDKTASSVIGRLSYLINLFGEKFFDVFKSITIDNGSEFSDWEGMKLVTADKVTFYYCHPYRATERGSNENENRFIRRFVPKGSDIGKFSDDYISEVQNFMNSYPRKILDYASAGEMIVSAVPHLAFLAENCKNGMAAPLLSVRSV